MQVCTSLQTDNYASTPPLSFLQAGCPSCRPTNSVNALKVQEPYTVLTMSNGSFLNWGQVQKIVMPMNCRSRLQWKNVRSISMSKTSSEFEVRYSMVENAVSHAFSFPQHSHIPEPKQLYRQLLPISAPKFRDLQHLCATNVIPGEFHQQFLALFVAEKWVDSVVSVERHSERIMVLKMVLGDRLLNVFSVYAPHSERPDEEKESVFGMRYFIW